MYLALFLVLKVLYIEGGESPQPPPMCLLAPVTAETHIPDANIIALIDILNQCS